MTITDMIEMLTELRNQYGNAPIEDVSQNRVTNVDYDEDYESYYIVFGG